MLQILQICIYVNQYFLNDSHCKMKSYESEIPLHHSKTRVCDNHIQVLGLKIYGVK